MIGQYSLLKLWNNDQKLVQWMRPPSQVISRYPGLAWINIHNFRRAKFVYNRYLQFTTQLSAMQTQNIQTAAAENR